MLNLGWGITKRRRSVHEITRLYVEREWPMAFELIGSSQNPRESQKFIFREVVEPRGFEPLTS